MRSLERAVGRAGFETLNLDYPSRRLSLVDLAESLHAATAAFAAERKGRVHFLTHSMGGLVARAYLHGTGRPTLAAW